MIGLRPPQQTEAAVALLGARGRDTNPGILAVEWLRVVVRQLRGLQLDLQWERPATVCVA